MNGRQVEAEKRIHHPAYELAATITRQSWPDVGMTLEELERDMQIAEALDQWIQTGHSPEDFAAHTIGSPLSKQISDNRDDSSPSRHCHSSKLAGD